MLEQAFPVLNKCSTLTYDREIFVLSDGGEIAIDTYVNEKNQEKSSKIMLMVPGVTGCSNDTYLKVIATSLIKSGIRPIVVNYRGLGGVKLKTPKLYCFGSYNDIDEAFEHLFAKHRDNTFYALGVSQGASILTNYLGKKSKECSKIKCAACIATPYDLILVDALASYPLQRLLGIVCKGVVEQHLGERMLFDEKYLNEVMPKIKTAREYNQYIVVPQFGYKTVNEYLRKESWYAFN